MLEKPTNISPIIFKKSFLYVLQPLFLVAIIFMVLGYFESDLQAFLNDACHAIGIKPRWRISKIIELQEVIGPYVSLFVLYRFFVFLTYRLEVKNGRIIEVNYLSLKQRDATDFTKMDDINVDILPWNLLFGLSSVSFMNRENGRGKKRTRDRIGGLSFSSANKLFEVLSQNTADNYTEYILKNRR